MTEDPGGPHPVTTVDLKAQIEAERSGQPFLAYRNADGERHLLTIEPGVTELWVGRSLSSDVQLSWDDEVSALHGQLEPAGPRLALARTGAKLAHLDAGGSIGGARENTPNGVYDRVGHVRARSH